MHDTTTDLARSNADVAGEITAAFVLNDGRPVLPAHDFMAFVDVIRALDDERRLSVAEDLAALAKRLWDTERDAWDDALLQLCMLVGVAVDDSANAMMSAGGDDDTAAARQLIAGMRVNTPVGAGSRVPGSLARRRRCST